MSTLFLGSGTIEQLAVLVKFQTSLHQGEVTSMWPFPMFIVHTHHFLYQGLASGQKPRVQTSDKPVWQYWKLGFYCFTSHLFCFITTVHKW